LPPTLYGLATLQPWPTAFGAALVVIGKLWFVHRIAWLHDATRADPPRPPN